MAIFRYFLFEVFADDSVLPDQQAWIEAGQIIAILVHEQQSIFWKGAFLLVHFLQAGKRAEFVSDVKGCQLSPGGQKVEIEIGDEPGISEFEFA